MAKNRSQQKESDLIDNKVCAAVIIPIFSSKDGFKVLLTKRTGNVKDHQNQISFPGGVCEKEDKTTQHTALREIKEEIGITLSKEDILGRIRPRGTSTGYYIYPYVAYLANIDGIKRNHDEVEKIINIPLQWLLKSENHTIRPYKRKRTIEHNVVFYKPYGKEIIWGITASIMLDFINEIKK